MRKYQYILSIRYLGFRYHGFQKQPQSIKTVQLMLDKTINFILKDVKFKTISSSRTDSMVSALKTKILLITHDIIPDNFLSLLNENLPADIEALKLKTCYEKIDIIGGAKTKHYQYFFCFGEKIHPFAAPYFCNIKEELDIKLMQEGALLFQGNHYLKNYCYLPNESQSFQRLITESFIEPNTELSANFFPKSSWIFNVKGKGFLRYQIRMMIGALFQLGMHQLTTEQIKSSLTEEGEKLQTSFIAPPSGLILKSVDFNF